MKKLFSKSNIFSFLLGAVIFSGITSVFAYTLIASDVGYTPTESTFDVDNVSDAIDQLYNEFHKFDLVFSYYAPSYNDGTLTQTTTLQKGKYILIVTHTNSEGFGSTMSISVSGASVSKEMVNYHNTTGETNVNMYHAILDVEHGGDITISVSQSIARGYSLKHINIYKI